MDRSPHSRFMHRSRTYEACKRLDEALIASGFERHLFEHGMSLKPYRTRTASIHVAMDYFGYLPLPITKNGAHRIRKLCIATIDLIGCLI